MPRNIEVTMLKTIFGIGAIGIFGLWYVSKKAREKLERGQNPLASF